jgi:hypothetical protein
MTLQYNIYSSDKGSGVTVILDGEAKQLPQDAPFYSKLVALLTNQADPATEEQIRELIAPVLTVGKALHRLSDRIIEDNGTLFFDGDPIDNSIGQHIIRILQEGSGSVAYGPLVRFMEKLYTNPSEESRTALYDYIVRYGLTIHDDGDFLAYKGVNADSTSRTSGFGIVDGVAMDGHLPNKVDSVLEMPRSKVNADNAIGCSTGLHAGTHEYASNFARGMLLLVKINPRDVVSVPADFTFQKIRTSRYVVLSQIEQEIKETTWSRPSTSSYVAPKLNVNDDDVAAIEGAIEQGNPIGFDYVSISGRPSTVEDFLPSDIEKDWRGDYLIIGNKPNGEYRSYKISGVTNLVIENNSSSTTMPHADAWVDPMADVAKNSLAGTIETFISYGESMSFDYTNKIGGKSYVNYFFPEEVKGSYVVGKLVDGSYRSYLISGIAELKGSSSDSSHSDMEETEETVWVQTDNTKSLADAVRKSGKNVKVVVDENGKPTFYVAAVATGDGVVLASTGDEWADKIARALFES